MIKMIQDLVRPTFLTLIFCLIPLGSVRAAEAPKVVVSIAPLHSLVASVMEGIGEPSLLMPIGASPHDYSMRPSDARQLHRAELVFWIGPGLEGFMQGMISNLAPRTMTIAMEEPLSKDVDEHDEHAQEDEHDEHAHAGSHPWLDPLWAIEASGRIGEVLSKRYPSLAKRIAQNVKRLNNRLKALDHNLSSQLSDVQGVPYLVYHEAYESFENRYHLNHQGAVALHEDRQPSPRHISKLRQEIKQTGIVCLFSEPQMKSSLEKILTEDTAVKTARLDPIGSQLEPGKDLYFDLLSGLGTNMKNCLK